MSLYDVLIVSKELCETQAVKFHLVANIPQPELTANLYVYVEGT